MRVRRIIATASVASSSLVYRLTDLFLPYVGDINKASANIKSHLPGSSPNAEKEMKHSAADAGAKIDKAVCFLLFELAHLKSA